MKRMLTMVLAIAAVALTVGTAVAHPGGTRVDRRQARQQARIYQGRIYDQLTRLERQRLHAGQMRIRQLERLAWTDGHVTARERWMIERAQDRQNRLIWQLRHNGRMG